MIQPTRDPRVVIFTDDPGWHGRMLLKALAARGIEGVYASLKDCHFVIAQTAQVIIPGFEQRLPRGAFVRGVPGGSLEQVVLRLDVLHCLALLNVPVFNSGRAIERTVDKALTSFRLTQRGVPTPRTWVFESHQRAQEILEPLLTSGGSAVIKPLFGSQGEGIARINSATDLAASSAVGGVYYLQEYVERGGPPYRDWRVLVIAGVARFAMERRSLHWVTNRAQGAECIAAELTPALAMLAESAAAAVDIDYAGVDLMQDAQGQWWVGEINGVPAWWGLTQATGQDVTASLVDAFVSKLERGAHVGDPE
jgi:tetrahydromethanopterin:alpha-L-glutamate ligase